MMTDPNATKAELIIPTMPEPIEVWIYAYEPYEGGPTCYGIQDEKPIHTHPHYGPYKMVRGMMSLDKLWTDYKIYVVPTGLETWHVQHRGICATVEPFHTAIDAQWYATCLAEFIGDGS